MWVDLIRAPTILLAAVVIGGCGAMSSQNARTGDGGGSALGQTIATAPASAAARSTASAATTATATSTAATTTSESIRLPPPPTQAAPRSRAILRVASRFAAAYLLYQIGRAPHWVRQAIRATCTPSFAQLLLSQPVNIPAAQRGRAFDQPTELQRVTYTGPASVGPGPPVQIVIARYRTVAHANVGGQLTIELAAGRGGWRVQSLR
jgi:hypothetical protein